MLCLALRRCQQPPPLLLLQLPRRSRLAAASTFSAPPSSTPPLRRAAWPLPNPKIQARVYSRSRGKGAGARGLSPEQLQLLFRVTGRVLGTALHAARRKGLHRSRPLLVVGLVLVPLTAGGAFLAFHLERAPMSGRLQLVFLDEEQEMELGAMAGTFAGMTCWLIRSSAKFVEERPNGEECGWIEAMGMP